MLAANKDLNKYIDMKRLKVLNATQESNVKFLFEDCMNGIESRVDPQIIIVISFCKGIMAFLNKERAFYRTGKTDLYKH